MVTDISIGDAVGVGWQQSACHKCTLCSKGEENDKKRLSEEDEENTKI